MYDLFSDNGLDRLIAFVVDVLVVVLGLDHEHTSGLFGAH